MPLDRLVREGFKGVLHPCAVLLHTLVWEVGEGGTAISSTTAHSGRCGRGREGEPCVHPYDVPLAARPFRKGGEEVAHMFEV